MAANELRTIAWRHQSGSGGVRLGKANGVCFKNEWFEQEVGTMMGDISEGKAGDCKMKNGTGIWRFCPYAEFESYERKVMKKEKE